MDDDDEFEYDEDFGSSGDEDSDQDIKVELEIDDLRLELLAHNAENQAAAESRLVEIAKDHSLKFCLEAALEVIHLSPSIENFSLLVEAVIAAPKEVSSLTRTSALKRGWVLIQNQSAINELLKTDAFKKSVESTKCSQNVSLVLKSLILLTSHYIQLERTSDAEKTLQDFSNTINSVEPNLLQDELQTEALVLQLEKLMLSPTLDLIKAEGITTQLDRTANGGLSPQETAIFEEAQARICVQRESVVEARSLLKRCVRRYEDFCDLPQQSKPCVRSIVWLILVSAICGQGNYDFVVDTPTLVPLSTDPTIACAVSVSQALQNQNYDDFRESLGLMMNWLSRCSWRLAKDNLLYQLNRQIENRLLTNALANYNYLKWDTIKERLPQSACFLATEEGLTRFARTKNLQSDSFVYLVNTPQRAIELTYRPLISQNLSKYPSTKKLLPHRYAYNDAHSEQVSTETEILNHWKAPKTTTDTRPRTVNSIERRYWAAAKTDDEVTQKMIHALRHHRAAQLEDVMRIDVYK